MARGVGAAAPGPGRLGGAGVTAGWPATGDPPAGRAATADERPGDAEADGGSSAWWRATWSWTPPVARYPDPLPAGLRADAPGWEVDWFQALKAGMGIELTLPDGADHLDQLLVVGVSDGPAAVGASQLRDLLLGHTFGDGLGLLGAGTPTNNTPGSRSGWSSRPSFPRTRRRRPAAGREPGRRRPGRRARPARRGVPAASCPVRGDAEPAAVAGLSLLTWGTLGKGFADAAVTHYELVNGPVSQVRAVDSARPWRQVRDQLAEPRAQPGSAAHAPRRPPALRRAARLVAERLARRPGRRSGRAGRPLAAAAAGPVAGGAR